MSFGVTLNIIWIYRDFLIHNLLQEAHRTDFPHLAIIHLVTDDIRIKLDKWIEVGVGGEEVEGGGGRPELYLAII